MKTKKLLKEIMKEVQRQCYNFSAWAVNHAIEFENEEDFIQCFGDEYADRVEWIEEDFNDVLSAAARDDQDTAQDLERE